MKILLNTSLLLILFTISLSANIESNVDLNNSTFGPNISSDLMVTAFCQDITIALDQTGNASILPSDIDDGSISDADIVEMTLSQSQFTNVDTGTNSVVLTVTDSNGDVGTCDAVVTVWDEYPPEANCQDITVELDATGSASITPAAIDNGSFDNGAIVSMTLDISDFDCSNVGSNTVILNVMDDSGNEAFCTAIVEVMDLTDPIADVTELPDVNAQCEVTSLTPPTATDNCTGSITGFHNSTLPITVQGTHVITWTYDDGNGNILTQDQIVIIDDVTDPVVICNDITLEIDETSGIPTATDNCDGTISGTTMDPMSYSTVGNYVMNWSFVDDSGNSTSCNVNVTVVNDANATPPTAICQDVTKYINANGNATILAEEVDNGSFDDGSIVSMSLNYNDLHCDDIGTQVLTLIVIDNDGYTSFCQSTVTVIDNIAPSMICSDWVIELNEMGTASISLEDVDDGSSDNCSMTLWASKLDFDDTNIGSNTVSLEGTDLSGNTGTCESTVVVEEHPIAPPQGPMVALSLPTLNELDSQDNIEHGEIESPISTRDNQKYTLSLYPNPALNGYTTLLLQNLNIGNNEVTIKLFDAAGTAVRYERRIISDQQAKIRVDGFEAYVTGLYTMQVIVNGKSLSEQFIIR